MKKKRICLERESPHHAPSYLLTKIFVLFVFLASLSEYIYYNKVESNELENIIKLKIYLRNLLDRYRKLTNLIDSPVFY